MFLVLTFSTAVGLFAAPLEGGYALAPKTSASPEEKIAAFREARLRVLSAAAKYEKTPYRYGGIDRKGLDCSGLVYLSFKDALGVSVPRNTTGLFAWAEKISNEKLLPGDLLFFKTDNTGKISHIAIYVGHGRFIHSASEGPVTGVMYSGLDERYWSRAYAGAGRALPEADISYLPFPAIAGASVGGDSSANSVAAGGLDTGASGWGAVHPAGDPPAGESSGEKKSHLLLGVAIAPTWQAFLKGGELVRGFASQLRLGAETHTFGKPMIFGLELRPEYDGGLGVFRLPITFSWGPSDKFLIFAGPVFSFGNAVISTGDGDRHYSGGTSWLGAVGISAAPFLFKIAGGELAPYFETAWQSYFSDNPDKNANADFSAGFRFSTGIRYTWKL